MLMEIITMITILEYGANQRASTQKYHGTTKRYFNSTILSDNDLDQFQILVPMRHSLLKSGSVFALPHST